MSRLEPNPEMSDSALARAALLATVLIFAAGTLWTWLARPPDALAAPATFTQYSIQGASGRPLPDLLIVPPNGPDIRPDARSLYQISDAYAGQVLTIVQDSTRQHRHTFAMTPSPQAQVRIFLEE
ncbi:MAG: hypothetical protein P1V81_11440 [Planctomycetota bacterium]|nr:hypothetical protein [Planctomycetota bacterium]